MILIKDPIHKNYFSRNVMSRERFELIMNFFHFDDQPKLFRLAKIKMIIDNFSDVMLQMITLDKNLSLDKSMMPWRGRLIFTQYIKNKRYNIKGNKFCKLCTYDGLVLNIEICGGQGFNDKQNLG